MFWWDDDVEERKMLREIDGMLISRLGGPFESREEYEWLRREHIRMRPPRPEVLTAGLDPAAMRKMLNEAAVQMREATARYESLTAAFNDGPMLSMTNDEVAGLLCEAAEPVGNALEALEPTFDLLYREYGGRGRVYRGLRRTLEAVGANPTSSSVAMGFEYACALCCTMERAIAPVPAGEKETSSLESSWCSFVQSEVVRSANDADEVPSPDALAWASLGIAGLSYVDIAERLECVCSGVGPAVEQRQESFVARAAGPQRIWPDYRLQVVLDDELASWFGASAYILPTDGNVEVWPAGSYRKRLYDLLGSCDSAPAQGDRRLEEWSRLAAASWVPVLDGVLMLPIELIFECDLPSIGAVEVMVRGDRAVVCTSQKSKA